MQPILSEIVGSPQTPEGAAALAYPLGGLVLLRSGLFDVPQWRYSFVGVRPFLQFRSYGATCILTRPCAGLPEEDHSAPAETLYGNPWLILEKILARFEIPQNPDWPFPAGGCFGYWGYDLKNHLEPKLSRRAIRDLDLPDCHLNFYDSLLVFDHQLGKTWVVSTGLEQDGSRSEAQARAQLAFWQELLAGTPPAFPRLSSHRESPPILTSNVTREEFIRRVEIAQSYIRSGDIYQVNLAQRLETVLPGNGFDLFSSLSARSPAPFSAYLDAGDFELVSSSPELFLRVSGRQIQTRPIKGTRPRALDHMADAQLSFELQTSPKEIAELVMITDLLRNDLGRCCEFGSVQVPELVRLEKFSHVQHLVSTVEGRLTPGWSHVGALGACFPGGSITGAPKFRAMEIIDELETTCRGPYTGALGYLGFNQESQLSIIIRTAIVREQRAWFHVGAGIVADSDPAMEYEETVSKAQGFVAALQGLHQRDLHPVRSPVP